MAGKYRGRGCVSRIIPGPGDCYMQVEMLPEDIHFFTSVMEAYCHLALIAPHAPEKGRLALHYTPEREEELMAVLENFPRPVRVLGR